MQKYLLNKFSGSIKKVEIKRETPKFYLYDFHNKYSNITTERKTLKEGTMSSQWFDTFEDAKLHLIDRAESAIEIFEDKIYQHKKDLEKYKVMKEDDR